MGPMGFQKPEDLFLWEAGQQVVKEDPGGRIRSPAYQLCDLGQTQPLCPFSSSVKWA